MKEKSRERLREKLEEWFETILNNRRCYVDEEDEQAYQQILKLIERKSKVTREFLGKWVVILFEHHSGKRLNSLLIKMLKEAGVEVEE